MHAFFKKPYYETKPFTTLQGFFCGRGMGEDWNILRQARILLYICNCVFAHGFFAQFSMHRSAVRIVAFKQLNFES